MSETRDLTSQIRLVTTYSHGDKECHSVATFIHHTLTQEEADKLCRDIEVMLPSLIKLLAEML
jgi:hypothetical protein